MSDVAPRRRYVDRPWRRWLIGISAAAAIHALVIWWAWPSVDDWVNGGYTVRPSGPITHEEVQRAIESAPIITGLAFGPSDVSVSSLLDSEELPPDSWAQPALKLEYTLLPHAPQRWLALAPPVAPLPFDRPPMRVPATASR